MNEWVGTKNKIYCVLGMHRSGTSLLGNILNTLGIPFGKNLIGANEHNKKGYWEDQEIVAIQDGLLIQLGLDWWKENSVDPYPKDFFLSPPLLNAQQKLKEVLSQRMEENGGVFGFKDPRTSRFLPIYKKIWIELQAEPIFILSVRNPRDVVHSIHLRDKIPQERILKIWLRYNFDAIRHSLDRLRAIVVFENWFQDFDAELSYLTQALDIDLTEATKTEILKIIQPELKHEPSIEWNIPLWAEWAYQSILSLRKKAFDSTFKKQLLTDFEWLLFRLQQGEENPNLLENKKRLAIVFSSPADDEAWELAKRQPKDPNFQISLLLAEGTPEKEFSSSVAELGMAIGQLPFDESPELLNLPICTKAIRPPFALYSYLKNRYYDQIILPVAKGIAFFALEAVHLPCLSSTEILLYGTTKHNENAYPNIENYLSFALEKETLTLSNKKDNPTDPQKDTPLLSICYVLHGEKQPPTAFPTNESIEWLFGMDEQRAIETNSSPIALSNGVYQLFFPPWISFLDRWKSLVRQAKAKFVLFLKEEENLNPALVEPLISFLANNESSSISFFIGLNPLLLNNNDQLYALQIPFLRNSLDLGHFLLPIRDFPFIIEKEVFLQNQSDFTEKNPERARSEFLAFLGMKGIKASVFPEPLIWVASRASTDESFLSFLHGYFDSLPHSYKAFIQALLGSCMSQFQLASHQAETRQRYVPLGLFNTEKTLTEKLKRARYVINLLFSETTLLKPKSFPLSKAFSFENLSEGQKAQLSELIRNSLLFDSHYYLEKNPDVLAAGVDPLQHYIEHGGREGRSPSPYFDSSYYVSQCPEIQPMGINPLVHFLLFGWKELKNPHPKFSTENYLKLHPDLLHIGLNPLTHFLLNSPFEEQPDFFKE